MGISTPCSAAASTRIIPCGAVTSRPLSEKVTASGSARASANRHLAHGLRARGPMLDRPHEVLAEPADGAGHRQHARVGQGAEHAALDPAAERLDQLQVLHPPLAVDDAPEDALEPAEALAAWRALAAALVPVELGQAEAGPDDAARVVHNDAAGAAQARARGGHRLVVERHVERLLADHVDARAPRPAGLEPPAGAQAAGHLEHQLAKGGLAHHDLVVPRPQHVPGDAEDLGPGALLGADRGVPVRPALDDGRERGQGLHVVDQRRAAVEAGDGREGRLEPGLAALALQALQHAGLLAADVGPGAPVDGDVEVEAGAEDVAAEVAGGPRLGDRRVEDPGLVLVLAADVDVPPRRAYAVAGEGHALQQLERVVLDDLAVLERTRLALVRVAHHVARAAAVLGHE